ncbi:MAG: phosphoglycerate dehydrogenase [Bacteroidetes bacterium]|nr:MAG: phosphoglycerate dehydrogenase [Bacteroidota bacterium]TAG90555.1 MAG: phosphoglycerate dehydrogenase [Bacteroidota bacterium]
MKNQKFIVIDFDSTFTKVEGLDELAIISLEGCEDKNDRVEQIQKLTHLGMEGKISFSESLQKRISLLKANKKHLKPLIENLKKQVSDSFLRNKDFLSNYAENILLISSGFKDFIEPIVTDFGIKTENIYANTFLYDDADNIVGYDVKNVLSQQKGKVNLLKSLNLEGDVYVIGDGYTDYEIREAGLANKFFAFTENIERESVIEKADHITPSLEEFLYVNKLPMSISYPKSRIQVLLLENIHTKATEIFKQEGYNIEFIKGALDEDELAEKIKNVHILGIRSKTKVTKKVLENANKLMTVGAFCIGTTQIDLDACAEKGIVAFNAPYSNTRSVVELALGEMIMLMRNIPDKSQNLHQGIWDKSASNSFEIRGKTLGLIGYGNIGSQFSVLAEGLGMKVIFYDVVEKLALGNATPCKTLEELLHKSDVISLHVDDRKSNHSLIGKQQFAQMKDGVIFINLSRGFVVEIDALVEAIQNQKVRGCAVDVFPYEPKTNDETFESKLRNLPNTILTPHIGGSTEEAQENIAQFVPNRIINFINKGDTFGSVNYPNLQLPEQHNSHRLIHVHKNTAGILAQINQALAQHEINILGQYLKTNEQIGYVITDINQKYDQGIIETLKNIPNTIKFRILY